VVVVVSPERLELGALAVAVADAPAPFRDAGGGVACPCTAIAAPMRAAVHVLAQQLRDRDC
jgi:hypothetical protein